MMRIVVQGCASEIVRLITSLRIKLFVKSGGYLGLPSWSPQQVAPAGILGSFRE